MKLIDLKRIERVIKLDKTVFKEIRDDKDALAQGIILVVLVALFIAVMANILFFIISQIQQSGMVGPQYLHVILPVLSVIFLFFIAIITHLIAKFGFKGKSSYIGYLKTLCFIDIITLLFVIPILISLASILLNGTLVVIILYFISFLIIPVIFIIYWIVATRETYEISTVKAIIAVSPLIVLAIILGVIIAIALAFIASGGGMPPQTHG